jgi:hypothetical protein
MKAKAKAKAAKAQPLFTIGYEQAKPAAVLNELTRAKIELLVDTRAVAASRRPGFPSVSCGFAGRGRNRLSPFAEARHAGGRPRGRA